MDNLEVFEYEPGEADRMEPLEVPDAIVEEWRKLRVRLKEIKDYLWEKRIRVARKRVGNT